MTRLQGGTVLIEHRQTIGVAVWELLWSMEHVTAQRNGIGLVNHAEPVKAEEIARDLRENARTVRRNLRRLARGGFLGLRRTPKGFQIGVQFHRLNHRPDKNVRSDSSLHHAADREAALAEAQ